MSTNVPEYSEDWFTRHLPIWEPILKPLKDNIIDAIEIGSFEGRSSVWLCENVLLHPQSHLTCLDTFDGGQDLGKDKTDIDWNEIKRRFFANTAPFQEKITVVTENSTIYMKKRMEPTDFIYVDGSHTAPQSLIDAVQSHLLLRHGGIIIFDDYLWRGGSYTSEVPKGSLDAFWSAFSDQYEILAVGYQLILRKK